MTSVAVLGVGAMGAPIAQRLLAHGHEVTVFDPRPEAVAPLTELHGRVAATPQDCGRSDVVLVLVATAAQVVDVLFGAHGLVSGVSRPAPLVIVMSTIGRANVVQVHERLAADGIAMIEAPISGGAAKAAAGTLSVVAGGTADNIERGRSILNLVGASVFHTGPIGTAQIVKIANNILGNLNTMATAEVYRLVVELGLDLGQVVPIFEASSGRNWLSAAPDQAPAAYAALTAVPFEATAAIMRKDTQLAVDLAAESTGKYPVVRALADLVDAIGSESLASWQIVADQQAPSALKEDS